MKRKRVSRQQALKKVYPCAVCGEDDYAVLDAHRIVPGAQGGKYQDSNLSCLCSCCHRRVHDGQIVIHGRKQDTLGRWFLHFTQDGEERWAKIGPKCL